MRSLKSACTALLLAAAPLVAQGVIVSPPVLVLDHRVRSGALELFNSGDRAIEVWVGILFGYPVTDANGEFQLVTPATVPDSMPAATAWLEAYPARATIPAGGRQTVRFLASPPANLPDGEYFTRVATSSKFAAARQDSVPADTARFQAQLSVEIRAITTLLYRKGAVRTGVAMSEGRAGRVGDSLVVRARIAPTGNAAFLGTLSYALEDSTGHVLRSTDLPIGIYVPIDPKIVLPVEGLNPGPYRVRISARAQRNDLLPETVLAIPESVLVFDTVLPPR